MCDVNKYNLASLIPEIESVINKSVYVAIDAEFTGLSASYGVRPSLFDSGAERYKKLRSSIRHFIPCQLGVAAFVKDDSPNTNRYVVHTYNCYIFPAAFGPIDVRFQCQSSCLEFLTKHKFDFNKFVYEGISLLNLEQEVRMKDYLSSRDNFAGLERDLDEKELQEVCSAVAEWLVNEDSPNSLALTIPEGLTDFEVVCELRARFPLAWAEVKDKSANKVVIEKVTKEQRDILDTEFKQQQEKLKLNEMLGFTQIFRILVDSKKPIVGHNCLMDLMLLHEKCHKFLPENYVTFKKDLHSLLPYIFDTKHISSYLRSKEVLGETAFFEHTGLGSLYESLTSKQGQFFSLFAPTVVHADKCSRYCDTGQPHEAGYDAYMCGHVFLMCAHMLASKDIKPMETRPLDFHEYLNAVKPQANKINIIRAAISYLCLDSADPQSLRPQWLYVKSLQGTIRPYQLARMFSSHGSVDIQMKSSKHAIVAVSNYTSARAILKAFYKHDSLYVSKYSTWKHSPVVRNLLVAGVALSTSLCLWSILSSKHK